MTLNMPDPRGYEPLEVVPAAENLGRIHFVGIGGVGMAPVARIAVERGLPVSGSDIKRTPAIDALIAAGARVRIGQAPENLDGVDTVVATTGVRPDNVELVEATRRGLRIVHRATALASLMVGRTAVLIAGTHGKTTTTSMLAVALDVLGLDPSYAIGGEIGASGISGHAGGGEVFVAEADESDGTFRHYEPDVAVVTNVELDHADHFASLDDVHKAFVSFVDRLKPGGLLVVCADDPGAVAVGRVARDSGIRVVWYGETDQVDDQTVDYRIIGLALAAGEGESDAARGGAGGVVSADVASRRGHACFDVEVSGRTRGQEFGIPGRQGAANAGAGGRTDRLEFGIPGPQGAASAGAGGRTDRLEFGIPGRQDTVNAGAGGRSYRLELGIPGRHNAANATAAFAVLDELGADLTLAPAAIAAYTGARRRMEFKGSADGVRVYDDYMHHPTEIAATLAAFRALTGSGRLIVAFQPQRFSRAQTFLRLYGAPLGAADAVVVMEVYPGSGEDPIPGVTGAVIADDVPLPADRVVFEPDSSAVAARLVDWARPGDVVVTAGAGDVTTLGPKILDLLRQRDGAAAAESAGTGAGSPS